MSRVRIGWILAVVAGVLGVGPSQNLFAGLSIVSQSVSVDTKDQEVLFSLVFNQAPDFQTTDSYGRHADSFQYEIVPNVYRPIDDYSFDAIRAVIRGDEISDGTITIRDGFEHGSDPSPAAGGWGAVLGTVPYSLQGGTHMSWEAPFSMLGTTNGAFAYRVFTTNYGTTVSTAQSVSIPLPAALPAGLFLLGMIAAVNIARRRRAARAKIFT